MLIICAGLQKSGSALCFNIINDLLVNSGSKDIRVLRKEYQLKDIIIQDDCYMHELNLHNFKKILPPLRDGNSVVIKTHSFPTKDYFEFVKDNVLEFEIKYIYTYRDPRDVVLSTLDHRAKEPSTFDDFDTFENAIVASVPLFIEALKWKSFEQVKLIRYEDFNNDIEYLTNSIQQYLNLPNTPNDADINNRYDKNNIELWDENTKIFGRLHFNKGISSRYLSELSDNEITLMESCLRYYIEKLGYTLIDRSDNPSRKLELDLTEFLGSLRSKDTLINTLIEHIRSVETIFAEEKRNNTALQFQLDTVSTNVADLKQYLLETSKLKDDIEQLQNEKMYYQHNIDSLDQEKNDQLSVSNSLINELDLLKSSHTYKALRVLSTPFSILKKRP